VDLRWWLTRVGIYFMVWTFVDVLAYWIRFSQPLPRAFLVAGAVASVWKIVLLLWFIPRRPGEGSDLRKVLLCVGIGVSGMTFFGYWWAVEFSRSWVAIDTILSGAALALASTALHRVHPGIALPPRPDLIT
jgi:hypothetical protein